MKTVLTALVGFLMASTAFSQDSTIVYFAFDKHHLSPAAQQSLDSILAKPYLFRTAIFGHTDQIGSHAYNQALSLRRANAVKDYLLQKGVENEKISIVTGFGEELLAINRLDPISRQANRRVVIITEYEKRTTDSLIIDKTPVDTPRPAPQPVTTPAPSRPERLMEKITDTTTKEGQNIILKHINFYGGRHVFLPQAYPALMELLDVMQSIPTLEIEIQGHICCKDDESDGLDIDTGQPFLSHNRARAVYEFLTRRGIDPKRLKYRGFGHRFPIIATERNEEERTINRRVEIRILKK